MAKPRGKDKTRRLRRTYVLSHLTRTSGIYAIVNLTIWRMDRQLRYGLIELTEAKEPAMAWFKIKAGAHSYKDDKGAIKVCRGSDSLGYQPGDEFFESEEDLAAKDPARWEASRGPAHVRAAAKAEAHHHRTKKH